MELAIKIMHDEMNICLVMQKAAVFYRYSVKHRGLLSKSNSRLSNFFELPEGSDFG